MAILLGNCCRHALHRSKVHDDMSQSRIGVLLLAAVVHREESKKKSVLIGIICLDAWLVHR